MQYLSRCFKTLGFIAGTCFLCHNYAVSQPRGADSIRINQVGYYPNGPKKAIMLQSNHGAFYLQNASGKKVFSGTIKQSAQPAFNGRYTGIADFSTFLKTGRYLLTLPDQEESYPVNIITNALKPVADGSIKAFYFIRASEEIKEPFAGKWHRAKGHPDDHVLVHSSAATKERPEGTVISSPGGWYDAGDYNKYIVNSGISTATLLSLYEDFPAYMKTVSLNIPESNNQLPDVLDEVLWNLRWMLTMQDPNDGGVYHKLTNAAFDGMEMPDKATATRYVVQKSTAASLDFAAVMAQACLIFRPFSKQLPGLSDSCLNASVKAWKWAVKNPDALYDQESMNRNFKPAITTGAYGDQQVADEFIWAAAELWISTRQNEYLPYIKLTEKLSIPTWSDVKMLGYYSLLRNSNVAFAQREQLRNKFLSFADELASKAYDNAYQTIINQSQKNFNWGSNSNAANQGIALIYAYQLTSDNKYLNLAIANADYLLGRNATGYSYLTGFGARQVMHPHHRPSVADGVVLPVPGLLAGGPNPGKQDNIATPSQIPDEAYIDDERAYAVNEIAINWNAPFAYLTNAIQAIELKQRTQSTKKP